MLKFKYLFAKGMKILLNPSALKNCKIHKTAKVCSRTELTNCTVDRYSYLGYQCFMVNTSIGCFCSISDKVVIGGAKHPIEYVSSSPIFHQGKNILHKNFSNHTVEKTPKTIIEHDVWIGQGVFIKAGIKISTGAVIGMGSVVTHNVGPYEIWAGNPAKIIRKRFDDDIIKCLLMSHWWELKDEKLEEYARYFDNPIVFIEKIRRKL